MIPYVCKFDRQTERGGRMRKPIKFHDSLSYKHHMEKSDNSPKENRSIYSECRISVYY